MKKRLIALTMACSVLLAMTGCGAGGTEESAASATTSAAAEAEEIDWENDPMAYLSGIKVSDYVELPANYNAMSVEVEPARTVTEEEVEEQVQSAYEQHREAVETSRTVVKEGDVACIDYVGTMDGKEFDGGSAEDYDLEIGSGSFIEGFEEGLIDHRVGEEVTLELTFPEDYGDTTKAGKDVQFDVTIKSIKEYEPLSDELVKRMGETDEFGNSVTTVDGYYTFVKNSLTEKYESEYAGNVNNTITQALVDGCTFKQDPPAPMVERIYQSFVEQLTYQASMYGLDLKTLMTLYGSTEETYEQDIRKEAVEQTKLVMALQAVAEKEGLCLTDKEFEAEMQDAIDKLNANAQPAEDSEEGNTEDAAAVSEEEENSEDGENSEEEADSSEEESSGDSSTTAAASESTLYSSVDDVPMSEREAYREYLDRQRAIKFLNEKTTVTAPAADEGSTAPAAEEGTTADAAAEAEENTNTADTAATAAAAEEEAE